MDYQIKIDYNKFIDVEEIMHEQNGELVKGLFIPIKKNSISYGRKQYLRAVEKRRNTYGQSHYLRISFNAAQRKEMERLGIEFPVVGQVSPLSFSSVRSIEGIAGDDMLDKILGK